MLRVIKELRPAWVVGENVAGFVNMALGTALADLESENYAVRAFLLSACGVEAPHQRYRVAIVAHRPGDGIRELSVQPGKPQQAYTDSFRGSMSVENANSVGCGKQDVLLQQPRGAKSQRNGANVADTDKNGLEKPRLPGLPEEPGISTADGSRRATQPGLGGNPDGFPHRLDRIRWPAPFGCEQYAWEPPRTIKGMKHRADRLKCLGNAVVPAQFYPIFAAIAEIERGAL